ncbi:MAG: tRNA (adenosine(37)-N6)-threonylcarbamoyltransferase complex dimerization subunit type 1 TsaB [Candidatus Bostrichicola ureolyticus]|nr:MAG: tRNA (adenosine(37)-N6)-threonylcarbamoyltransferase complex dimerization subunit type 1 TsaB [Candidatus Bostrichicola ureolyticus]
MALILNIETSTTNCSVSISKNGKLLSLIEENTKKYIHSEKLHLFINNALKNANFKIKNLNAVCVSKGPGSYTSLRIGVSTAKGICYCLHIPLLSIDSLSILIKSIDLNIVENELIIPMINTCNNEVYTTLFNNKYKMLIPITTKFFNKELFKEYYLYNKICISNEIQNENKCKMFLTNFKHFIYAYPSAKNMVFFSEKLFEKKDYQDITYFEPFYLKNYKINPSKV